MRSSLDRKTSCTFALVALCGLGLGLLPALPALAAPPSKDRSLDAGLRRVATAVAKSSRARGATPVEIRGRVQEALVQKVKAERARSEYEAMTRAGLAVPYREVRAFVEREFESFLKGYDRQVGWDELSPGRRFGVFFTSLRSDFAAQRTFPSNFSSLDPGARARVARCFAGGCTLEKAPVELDKWTSFLGGAKLGASSGKPLSTMEKMLATSAGGSKPAPVRYYGPETEKAIENFKITGLRVPMDLIIAVADVKAAAAIANMRTGRLDRRVGGAIVKAAREIRAGRFADQFVTDPIQGGAGTSVNMNVNEVIAARASEILTGKVGDYKVVHPNDHVNMAQSTNDVYPTASRLAAYRRLGSLVGSYELLVTELEAKAKDYATLPKPGRTHLEDAVPIMLGREFKAYAAVLRRDIRDIKLAMKGLTSVNLGGTAVGTTLNAEPAYVKDVSKVLSRISGVPVHRARDLVDGTQNVDSLTRAHATLKVSSSNLIKICNDLRLMNSGPRAGIGEITLPEQQKGSSIMPGKVNPVIAEVMNQISYQVQGNDTTVNLVAQNGQFELNQMEPVLVHNLLGSIQILDRGARTLAEKAIRGLKANDETCLSGAKKMLGLATALVPRLGYDRSAQLAKTALKTGKPLQDLVVESGDLSAAEAARLLDPARMARGGMM
jgi:aspartate ammonia-lyase